MEGRRQRAAGGQDEWKKVVLTALIAALIGLGAQQNVAEGYAKDYVKTHAISAQDAVQQYVDDAIIQIASQVSDTLCQETKTLEDLLKVYMSIFSKEPHLGLPIGELSLFDQVREIKHRIQVLKEAISSRHQILDEPMQKMGAGLPPPIFYSGSNDCAIASHCAIASMLSLISVTSMLLGYTGNAPPRSFSIVLGEFFKSAVKIRQDRCIVIEDIFKHLSTFLDILREQFPPYAPFLDRIFTLFSSKTFSKNKDGTCSPHEGSKEVLSYLKMLEESKESLGNSLQLALLSCGSEQVHSHLQMKPGAISAFCLPCESLNIDITTGEVLGRIPQIPFTAESMASFQLFGKTVGSGLQFDIASNLFAAICDTRGRNQNFSAEDAQNVGTSHYYLVIFTGGGSYFYVDSSRTNVQEISQEDFLRTVNDNGIVIFMRNRVEQEVPQQVAKIASQSHPSVRKHSTGGGAAAVPEQPAPSFRKPSAGGCGCADAEPSFGNAQASRQPRIHTTKEMWQAYNNCGAEVSAQPAPSSSKSSASGGAAAEVSHQSPPSFSHSQPSFDIPFVILASSLCASVFSKPDGFFRAIQQILEERGECPKRFQVTGLKIPSSCAESIQLYGSLPVSNDETTYYPFRGTTFVFNDRSVKKYDGSVDTLSIPHNKEKFSRELRKHWRDSKRILTGIQFEQCALKQIPSK
jgi:hypothetical protein